MCCIKYPISIVLLFYVYMFRTTCQLTENNIINEQMISAGSEKFALDLFRRISAEIETVNYDFMISPFSIWVLLILTAEGAKGNSLRELQNVLRISPNFTLIRDGYKQIQHAINVNTSTIEVTSFQALFYDVNRPVASDYLTDIQRSYRTKLLPTNFRRSYEAQQNINNYVYKATKGFIEYLVDEKDLIDAHLILISTIFFKGQWKFPFNASLTKQEQFYNENSQPIGTVNMMYQRGPFPYTAIKKIDSYVLELPYGKEDRLVMIILLPKKGTSLTQVVEKVATYGIANIYAELRQTEMAYEDDEVEVFLPRFTTTSDFVMNIILEKMGILDIFDSVKSNLSKMSTYPLYVSSIFHKTKIEVTEDGTTAAAATVGVFTNKATPPRFYVNRPFAYIILEKTSNLLVFCGQVRSPTLF